MPKQRKVKNATGRDESTVEEYIKKVPSPPKEHAYEFKMEKCLKRLIEEQKKRWSESTTMGHRN